MPSKNPTLTSEPRKILGRKVKQLRREGLLPANIYGKDVKSLSIQLSAPDFTKVFAQVGETGLIDLTVKGEKSSRPVLVHHFQIHPVSDLPIHVDFRQVDLKQKIAASVPVEITGEAPAVAQKGGVLIQPISEIEVEALPADFPDKFTIDVSSLVEINDSILLKDIKYDQSKVTIELDQETLIAKVEPPTKEEEEVKPAEEEAVEGEEAEGEEAKEGEEKKVGEKKEEEKAGEQKPTSSEGQKGESKAQKPSSKSQSK
jgi:large subunit ribosomal protein L25